jgi:hypothetical protein
VCNGMGYVRDKTAIDLKTILEEIANERAAAS